MLSDHLGSVETIVEGNGGGTPTVLAHLSYDAFGKRRDAVDWDGPVPTAVMNNIQDSTTRGFTGHEHQDSTGDIHMNGRVYDPNVGRFMSADPFVPNPMNAQSHNRYSYVNNRPLSFTDPSGFTEDDVNDTTDPNRPGSLFDNINFCIFGLCTGVNTRSGDFDPFIVGQNFIEIGLGDALGRDSPTPIAFGIRFS